LETSQINVTLDCMKVRDAKRSPCAIGIDARSAIFEVTGLVSGVDNAE